MTGCKMLSPSSSVSVFSLHEVVVLFIFLIPTSHDLLHPTNMPQKSACGTTQMFLEMQIAVWNSSIKESFQNIFKH